MKKKILKKILKILKKYNKIENFFLKKKNISINNYNILNKKYIRLNKIINYYKEWKKYKYMKKKSKKLIKYKDIKELAINDIKEYETKILELESYINKIFKKKSKKQNIFLEIKNGTGGEESSIFAFDLLKMYIKYIEKKKWNYKIISLNTTNLGGYKNVIMLIKGKNVYNDLKFESGVHRVQRKPKTENQDRIHTSTCKIAIFPKFKKYKFKLKKQEIKIDTFKSSGAGGQHVNKTNSAVRIKHIPTNITVECQNERSQHKNKKEALNLLKSKIFREKLNEKNKLKNEVKKSLFGSGDRSEKIRTYDYTKNRLTDHRINLKINELNSILEGNLNKVIKNLKKINIKKNE